METTIGLSKLSSSLPLRMQCAHRKSRGLYLGCNVKGKVKGEVDKCFEICRANSQEDYGATNNEPNNHEEHQHYNPV